MSRYRTPAQIQSHRKQQLERARNYAAFLAEFKRGKPCVDCKQVFDPCVMDFDHLDASKKRRAIGQMATWSRETLMTEIHKCDLVCSNCHRMRTKNRRDKNRGVFFVGFRKINEKQLNFL